MFQQVVEATVPGATRTLITRDAWESEDSRKDLHERFRYGPVGGPGNSAGAVPWPALDASSAYVNGQTGGTGGGSAWRPGLRGEG